MNKEGTFREGKVFSFEVQNRKNFPINKTKKAWYFANEITHAFLIDIIYYIVLIKW